MSKKLCIAILNSSSFGKHHADHIASLEEFAQLRTVNVPADASPDLIVSELQGVQGVVASVTPRISREALAQLPELILIARHGIGCDNVDLEAATQYGVYVSRVDGPVERNAVAEMAVALMLSSGRYLLSGANSVAAGNWHERAKYVGLEISGKTVGLIGIGNIGSRVAEILGAGFGARVLASDPYLTEDEISRRGAISTPLDELLSQSDIVSFHCPAKEDTMRMLNADRLATMKKGALLINTCRGELLDESALIACLDSGQLGAYGTDVVEGEPIGAEHRILKAQNVVVLPHLGGYTKESLRGMGDTMVADCQAVFVHGKAPALLANPEIVPASNKNYSFS